LSRFVPALVVLVLVAGTAAAFTVAERLKLERSPVVPTDYRQEFSPVCGCETARAVLPVRFRRAETVTATIVAPTGETVRTLAEREQLERGRHVYTWDGRDDAGAVVADGRYLLRLWFVRERRSILIPITIRVDTRPPRLRQVVLRPKVFSPDGDGRGDRLRARYVANERATAELVVDGRVAVRTLARAKGSPHGLQWLGRFATEGGELVTAKPGDHEVELVVRDLAGNEAVRRFTVRLRYIELDRNAYEAETGGELRFSVDTDALEYGWFLYRPRQGRLGRPVLYDGRETERSVTVPIPADAKPGTYILRVIAVGHRARATVAVTQSGP
jgi:hypothetical protein